MANKTCSYKELISKSETEVQAELIDLAVDQAQNSMQQGILSVRSQMLSSEADFKRAQNKVADAERELTAAKRANPLNVQDILDTRTLVLNAKDFVKTKEETFNTLKEAHDFLVATEKELFG